MAEKDRMERILALLLLHNMPSASQQEKIIQLNLAGFSNLEIADLLQTTSAVVSQTLYASRKARPRRRVIEVRRKKRSGK